MEIENMIYKNNIQTIRIKHEDFELAAIWEHTCTYVNGIIMRGCGSRYVHNYCQLNAVYKYSTV